MSSKIQAISLGSVHKITSGQVIVDLNSAVKELVENSLDAGASSVDIRLHNHGADLIEVIDNGSGITKENYDSIALKHYTSKLRDYEDLNNVQTFGFRGEAMSSLCAVSQVSIITATLLETPKAHKLEFDNTGKIIRKSIVSGLKGTHVTAANLFSTIPVRRKDFVKNSRREFNKVLALLQAYAIIATNVKFTVSHTTKPKDENNRNGRTSTGRKSVLISSRGNTHISDNIINIYGASGMKGLTSLDLKLTIPISRRFRQSLLKNTAIDTNDPNSMIMNLNGYISEPSFGQGRTSIDRQLLFINSRPVSLPQVTKVFNEVYKMFNHLQYPVIIVDLKMQACCYDVNVTPDKRTILIHEEANFLGELRESLIQYFEKFGHIIPKSDNIKSKGNIKQSSLFGNSLKGFSLTSDSNINTGNGVKDITQNIKQIYKKREESQEGLKKQEYTEKEEEEEEEPRTDPHHIMDDDYNESTPATSSIQPETYSHKKNRKLSSSETLESETPTKRKRLDLKRINLSSFKNFDGTLTSSHTSDLNEEPIYINIGNVAIEENSPRKLRRFLPIGYKPHLREKSIESLRSDEDGDEESGPDNIIETISNNDIEREYDHDSNCSCSHKEDTGCLPSSPPKNSHTPLFGNNTLKQRVDCSINLSKSSIINSFKKHYIKEILVSNNTEYTNINQAIKIFDISQSEDAENQLSMTISKKDFKSMKIVGQFNLGFILATKRSEKSLIANQGIHDDKKMDLFIIDQHASDEIYNFERLQRETTFRNQPLVIPKILELSPADELIITSNIDVFLRNGFRLKIHESNPPGSKVELKTIPFSKNVIFDERDLYELIHLISESHGSTYSIRCSKVRKMFASRACRSSIMIGKHLNKTKMETVVGHLGELEKPWNCPHGRPTMRHLMEFSKWNEFTKDTLP